MVFGYYDIIHIHNMNKFQSLLAYTHSMFIAMYKENHIYTEKGMHWSV